MFRSLNKEENKIVDIAYNKDKYEENSEDPKTENINEKNDLCKLYEISYLEKVGEYPKKVKYFIDKENNKNFDIIFYKDGRTEFNFDNLGNIDYEIFREKLYKILNDFKNTEVFDKYLSWSLYGLAKFKLKDKEDNEKTIFFHNVNINNIKKIIEDNFDKVCIFDFSFSSDNLKEDFVNDEKFKKENDNSGHAITLMAIKGKIVGVNTGFKSIEAFKKLKKELKTIQNVEKVFQIPFDVSQKGGSCEIASKFWAEAILSSVVNRDSIENSLAKFINNMWIQKKLLKTKKELLKKEKRLKKLSIFY